MRKLILFCLGFASFAMAQYFPPLGGGSSGGSVTVNGTSCTIGSTCTVTSAPSGAAGGDLAGTYPNPTIATVNAGVGTFGSATQSAVVVANAKGQITGISNVTIAGVTPAGAAGGVLTGTYPNPTLLNLTTVGAIPYVSASGLVSQDQTAGGQFFWDATNHRLGIGTVAPAYRLDVGTSGGFGTARFFDQTATTGATLVTITKGAGQTSSTQTLVSDASASFVGNVAAGSANILGNVLGGQIISAAGGGFSSNGRSYLSSPADGIFMVSNNAESDFNRLQFGGTTSSFGALARDGAALRVTTADSATVYADLSARHVLAGNATPPSLGGACSTAASGTLTDESGKLTTTTTGTCTFTITFGTAYVTDSPSCSVFNETTANLARPSATTAVLTGVVTTVTGDTISYSCRGHKP